MPAYFFLLASVFHVQILKVVDELHLLANGTFKLVFLQKVKPLQPHSAQQSDFSKKKKKGD